MTNLVRFPGDRRIPAATIPRAEFERLAELALDVVDRIVLLLDDSEQFPREASSSLDVGRKAHHGVSTSNGERNEDLHRGTDGGGTREG